MQGKLRLKAHKLWSRLAVSFRKLPQMPLPAKVCSDSASWKDMHLSCTS